MMTKLKGRHRPRSPSTCAKCSSHNGGEIRFRTKVEQILVDHGAVDRCATA